VMARTAPLFRPGNARVCICQISNVLAVHNPPIKRGAIFDDLGGSCHTQITRCLPPSGFERAGKLPIVQPLKHSASATHTGLSRDIAIAVLGTGSIGMRHLRVLRDLVRAPVSASPVRETRRSVLEKDGFRVHKTLQEAVEAGTRAVVVATDTARHLSDLRSALTQGCSVLVEKPLAAKSQGFEELAELFSVKERVYVACDLRFDDSLLEFRRRLPEIGAVHAVRIACQSYLPSWRPDREYRESYSARAAEGGVLLDLIHEVDYAVWLFGAPTRVLGRLTNLGRLGIESEEVVDLYWETPEKASVSIHLDYLTRTPHRKMQAFGEYGEIEWDGVAQSVSLQIEGGGGERDCFPLERDAILREQDTAFLRATEGKDPATLATFEDGAVAVGISDAARLSSVTGKFEAVMNWRRR
jgi:predicted dehydrogenase